jgi:MFS transporter, DHA2 family, multidrug resistance protein
VTETPVLPSPFRRTMIAITVMSGTLMQVLDATIANVALPHMQAALSAAPDTITWVLTSYIVMSAIATPITGWMEGQLGRKRLLALSIAGFTVTSALCGLASSLQMMVIARAFQGLFGAFIAPIAQAAMLDSTPRAKHAQAMTIYTMGVLLGPIMGPLLGGWITENINWRWVFYINVPIGIFAMFGTLLFVDEGETKRRNFDRFGFILLALALGSLQLMLDRGPHDDWFDSTEIIIELGIAASAFWMFIVHSATSSAPLVPLALFKDRNFSLAIVFMVLVSGTIYAGAAMLAPLLQILMGYDSIHAGWALAPRGISALFFMPLAARLNGRLDPRILVGMGVLASILSLRIMTGASLEMSEDLVAYAMLIQGIGVSFTFMPLSLMAFSTLAPHLRTEGAAMNNLARNMGASIFIAISGALVTRNVQVSHSDLAAHFTPINIPFLLPEMVRTVPASGTIAAMIDVEINRQAAMIAYLDSFWAIMWMTIISLPLVLLLQKPKSAPPPAELMAME